VIVLETWATLEEICFDIVRVREPEGGLVLGEQCSGSSGISTYMLNRTMVRRNEGRVLAVLALTVGGLVGSPIGCEKKAEPVAAPVATLTVGPGLKVYVPSDPLRVSIVLVSPEGGAKTTFAGRVSGSGEVFVAGEIKSGESARLRFDRGGMPGRGDPPTWFKSDGVTELAKETGVAEYVYKGGAEEITVSFDGMNMSVEKGASKTVDLKAGAPK